MRLYCIEVNGRRAADCIWARTPVDAALLYKMGRRNGRAPLTKDAKIRVYQVVTMAPPGEGMWKLLPVWPDAVVMHVPPPKRPITGARR